VTEAWAGRKTRFESRQEGRELSMLASEILATQEVEIGSWFKVRPSRESSQNLNKSWAW
jgi:hypothetical protein